MLTKQIIAVFIGLLLLSCSPSSSSSATVYPETCKDVQDKAIKDTGARPPDGTYTLYIDGKKNKPWDAFCRRMNLNTPVEYLTVDQDHNYSSVGILPDATVTSFRRYRVDPSTLQIDLLDDVFATSDGDPSVVPDDRNHIPAGWAQFASGANSGGSTVKSEIDLEGTAFAFSDDILIPGFFCTVDSGGDSSHSSYSIAADLTSLILTAFNTTASSQTKTVADCANLSPNDQVGIIDYVTATIPLQYVGN